jgi:hypothetical protein
MSYSTPGYTTEGTQEMTTADMSYEGRQQLALDVARVLRDYHESVGNYDTPTAEVLAEVRAELEQVDIAHLVAGGVIAPADAVSYGRVLAASAEDLASSAVTSHAEDLVDGSAQSYDFGNYDGADLEQGVDEWLEEVMTAESADADAACAAACAAAVTAEREARARGDNGAVAVVVVEDVLAPCDEDGGF